MADSNTKFIKGITVKDNSLTPKEIEIIPGGTVGTLTTIQGSQTANRLLTLPDATDTLVAKTTVDTLTNKTINADNNTLSNIANANIKTGAAIDATKIADGSVSNTEFQYLDGVTSSIQTQLNNAGTGLSNHITNPTDAHDGSAISYVPGIGTTLTADNVQDAIDQDNLQLVAHVADDVNAHAASAISSIPLGNLLSTNVQDALYELQTDVDGKASAATLSAHTGASSGVHGVAGSVVGTTDTQTLTNKDIDGGTASNTSRITLPKASKATLDGLTRKEATLVYASDEDKIYYDTGAALVGVVTGSVLTNPMTTTGDVIYSSDNSGTPTRLGIGTSGQYLTVSSGLPAWTTPLTPTIQKFTSGSGTYTTPAGVKYLRVRMVGPGGGGAGSSTQAADNYGAGGNGSAATTFGTSLLSAGAGSGGGGPGSGAGGAGGTASISAPAVGTTINGGSGSNAYPFTGQFFGAPGAVSFFGGAGKSGAYNIGAGGTAAANSGSGGGGAGCPANGVAGASGGAGAYVEAIITSPSATYSYVVGAGGAAGTAGTGGAAGGAGGSGYIEVTEYY